jgi:hypothetical protein
LTTQVLAQITMRFISDIKNAGVTLNVASTHFFCLDLVLLPKKLLAIGLDCDLLLLAVPEARGAH